MADVFHMYPDLVGAPGCKPHTGERIPARIRKALKLRDRALAVRPHFTRNDRAVHPADGRVDRAARRQFPGANGQIFSV